MTQGVSQSTETFGQEKAIYQEVEQNRYPWWKFCLEGTWLSLSIYLWVQLIIKTTSLHSNPLPTLIGFVVSQFLVDFVSGVVHWAGDTWGTFNTLFFGPALIQPFRMHHVDPQDITIHSFMETNAASSYPMPPLLIAGLFLADASFFSQTYCWMIIFGVPIGVLTNECHKWAHMVHSKPHPVVRFLQKAGFIISHEKHHIHHQGDFDKAYCIINGWMNPILDYFHFWKHLEELIVKVTGAVPREDDKFWREVKATKTE
jgi:plasmanylethanolamine desaturase